MRIVQVAAEFSPLAKAGGLGEVVLGLSRELTQIGGLEVDVIIPKYDFIDFKKIQNINMEVPDFKCFEKGALHANAMWSGLCEECNIHLLEARHPSGYFHRGKIYGGEDETSRFIYFSRAVLEYLLLKKRPIDVLHLHDWHVSLCAPMVRELFANELKIQSILLTIHNGEYQGKCAPRDLDAIGLKGEEYLVKEKLQDNDPAFPQTINLLKGGIVYADGVNAVSPTYLKELLTPEKGFKLDPTYRKYKSKLTGILNGIDQKFWNPATDPHLAAHYDSKSTLTSIQNAKESNKEALRKRFRLPPNKRPWVGAITRLTAQKGPELIEEALTQTLSLGGAFLLLGSPDDKNADRFAKLKIQYAKKAEVFVELIYDDPLAHLLYAALDFIIVPSHFEPCGLTQIIAMRYGTIPIVSSTGGLKDTVFDCENPLLPFPQRNGFVFSEPKKESMSPTIKRAFEYYLKEPHSFQPLIQRDMQIDFSWRKPAQSYLKLYRKLTLVNIIPNLLS